jgi:GTP pyrophosphokinase
MNVVVTAKARTKIKDSLKEEKKAVAEEGKYTLQRKLEGLGVGMNQHNIDELVSFYKLASPLELYFSIAIKTIDLKELKDFKTSGDKLEAPSRLRIMEPKPEYHPAINKKDTELIIFGESSDRIVYNLANCCKPIPG